MKIFTILILLGIFCPSFIRAVPLEDQKSVSAITRIDTLQDKAPDVRVLTAKSTICDFWVCNLDCRKKGYNKGRCDYGQPCKCLY
uniref:Putative salivary protein n=1 Tax=Culicoides sonorensis TaxID=179676 RepID=Q66U49_CULSO|nr:putative salivary protein [Culicoides sonorensis]